MMTWGAVSPGKRTKASRCALSQTDSPDQRKENIPVERDKAVGILQNDFLIARYR